MDAWEEGMGCFEWGGRNGGMRKVFHALYENSRIAAAVNDWNFTSCGRVEMCGLMLSADCEQGQIGVKAGLYSGDGADEF